MPKVLILLDKLSVDVSQAKNSLSAHSAGGVGRCNGHTLGRCNGHTSLVVVGNPSRTAPSSRPTPACGKNALWNLPPYGRIKKPIRPQGLGSLGLDPQAKKPACGSNEAGAPQLPQGRRREEEGQKEKEQPE